LSSAGAPDYKHDVIQEHIQMKIKTDAVCSNSRWCSFLFVPNPRQECEVYRQIYEFSYYICVNPVLFTTGQNDEIRLQS